MRRWITTIATILAAAVFGAVLAVVLSAPAEADPYYSQSNKGQSPKPVITTQWQRMDCAPLVPGVQQYYYQLKLKGNTKVKVYQARLVRVGALSEDGTNGDTTGHNMLVNVRGIVYEQFTGYYMGGPTHPEQHEMCLDLRVIGSAGAKATVDLWVFKWRDV